MAGSGILLICIFVPFLGSFLLPFCGRINTGLRNIAALLLIIVSFVMAAASLPAVIAGRSLLLQFPLPLGLTFGFCGDGLAVWMALIVAFVAAITVIYSLGYLERHQQNQNEYYMMLLLLVGATMGVIFATNLILIYVFWAVAGICCWRLIGFYRGETDIHRASKALLILGGGGLLMLAGFIAVYVQSGTFDLLTLRGGGMDSWVMVLILFGVLSHGALLPLHSWLADTDVAPAPVSALLQGALLVPIGAYVYARLFLITFALDLGWSHTMSIIALVSALVAAGAALKENDMKRILAYSTISQMGFIFFGLSCGTEIGATGALLYIGMHALFKSGLFFCAGIVEHSTQTRDIRQMGGLGKQQPLTMTAFILCAFASMALPPFGCFFAEYMIIDSAIHAGFPWYSGLLIIGALMTIWYMLRLFTKVFLGESTHPDAHGGSWETFSSALFLGALSLMAGIFVNVPANLVNLIIGAVGRW